MRYSYTALVLAISTIGQVTAGPVVQHNHARFHVKKEVLTTEAEAEKRDDPYANVDWSKVAYTYSANQQWGSESTAAPAAPAATAAAAVVVPAAAAVAATTPTSVKSAAASTATAAAPGTLSAAHAARLKSMGALAGANAVAANGGAWLGAGGAYTNEFINGASEDLILVLWGSEGSWVNAVAPAITVSLPKGSSQMVSFADNFSGAAAAIYADTALVNGQVSNTWWEVTTGTWGAFDVSREVNMAGHSISSVGPTCTSDMSKCVFLCNSGNVCTTGYTLSNCASGSQVGAVYGQYDGADSGGCGNMGASAAIKTTFA
jgi:hypothetical protein